MPEPISEQIALRAVAVLRGITRTAGYPVTATVRRFDERGNPKGEPNTDVVIVVEAMVPEWKPEIAPLTQDGYELTLQFHCFVHSPESTTVPRDTLMARVMASITKAWATDYSFNGLALNSELGKPSEGNMGEIPVTIQPCTVWFYTARNDPFNQN